MENKKKLTIKIYKQELAPSQGKYSTLLYNLFIYRTLNKFIGDSEIGIADILEPIWWNRPLTSDTFCKLEADGLYSYNFPLWNKDLYPYKSEYNCLLNKNSVPIAINIKVPEEWNDTLRSKLSNMLSKCIYDTLIELGVPSRKLTLPNNDFYYLNKKFGCIELIFKDNIFTLNAIITLRFNEEKEIFNRLTGNNPKVENIIGISDKVSSITKEIFIDKLLETLSIYVNKYFKVYYNIV